MQTEQDVKATLSSSSAVRGGRLLRVRQIRAPDESLIAFHRLLTKLGPADRNAVDRAERFVVDLDYQHEGQTKSVYLAHPFRVASMYLAEVPSACADGIMTALAHNVFEVTNVSLGVVAKELGPRPADAITALTIDRSRQLDHTYLRSYYARIEATPLAGPVKVLDKLDNLFMLCLNGDGEVRARYLDEIDEYLVPLAANALPQVVKVIEAVVTDSRKIGHCPLARLEEDLG